MKEVLGEYVYWDGELVKITTDEPDAETGPLPSGLDSHWEINVDDGSTLTDQLGDNDGTVTDVTLVNDDSALENHYYAFGDNSRVVIDNGSNFVDIPEFSLALWIKTFEAGEDANDMIIGHTSDTAAADGINWAFFHFQSEFRFSPSGESGADEITFDESELATGLWEFVVLRYNGTENEASVWKMDDGSMSMIASETDVTDTISDLDDGHEMVIGANGGDYERDYTGDLDAVYWEEDIWDTERMTGVFEHHPRSLGN